MNNTTSRTNIPVNPFYFPQEEENEINLKELVYKYLAYWKWFALSLTLALAAAFFYLKTQNPQYKITSSLLIKDNKNNLGQDDLMKQLDIFSSNKVVDNEIEILKSFTLMEKVVTNLNLNIQYFTSDQFKDIELYGQTSPIHLEVIKANDLAYEEPLEVKILNKNSIEINGKSYPVNQEVQTESGTFKIALTGNNPEMKELSVHLSPIQALVEGYLENLKVETSSKMSSVLMLSLESPVQEKGKDILNKLIEVYNAAGLEDKNKVAANTLVFIDERLALISKDLTEVEKNVEEFKSREGITDISAESKLFLESVKENDAQLNQVKIQQGVLNSIEQYVRNKENKAGTVPATLGLSDPVLLGLLDQLAELEAKRVQTSKLVKADNPMMIAIEDQISNLKKSLNENIQTFRKSLAITRQQLERQNAKMESLIRTVPGKERALLDISRQQAIKNNLYIFLLQKREETALAYASAVSDSRTIDEARSSNKPVKPVKRNIFLLFALAGLGIPFGFIYLIDLLNDKVKNKQEIKKATQAPILADISLGDQEEAIVINHQSRSVIAEQIRGLRTNLSFLAPGKGVQTILFTSSISGEGKSFVSLNLGASLAMTDKRTVILEMDMRKPKLHAGLEIPNTTGISSYLIGKAGLHEILRPVSGQENYYVITCGPIPPNPVELLVNGRLSELFQELKEQFDYIVVDAPPVGMVTDAQVLGQHADATLFLVRHNFTHRSSLKQIDALYKEQKFQNLNLVFNAVKHGGKYGYGYSYGYGYYN
ncbi:GumC family protein [Adhaeribacter terreus]|uniref:GumC family protein n=1 Tax=Adhaeribacter terreus TaxID=529703 RepID=A0ABW0EES8_9BACT